MRKKLIVVTSLLLAMSSLQIMAKGNKKDKSKSAQVVKELSISSANDTLSYAYGAALIEGGLKQYLEQQGIDGDAERMALFLKGLNESLPSKGANSDYIMGLGIGDQIYKMSNAFLEQISVGEGGDSLNIDLVTKGVGDALSNNQLLVDSASVIVNNVMVEANKKMAELKKEEDAILIDAAKQFMEDNSTKDGVVTLPSGLQYKIVIKGNGEIPTADDNVIVNYKGTLTDGTEFDSSFSRNEPLKINVSQVIKGWTEALQLMPVGSKWVLYIPYDLAYGANGTGPIPPYSDLIFEIDLIGIENSGAVK